MTLANKLYTKLNVSVCVYFSQLCVRRERFFNPSWCCGSGQRSQFAFEFWAEVRRHHLSDLPNAVELRCRRSGKGHYAFWVDRIFYGDEINWKIRTTQFRISIENINNNIDYIISYYIRTHATERNNVKTYANIKHVHDVFSNSSTIYGQL